MPVGDLAMMKDASLGSITPDWKYDLNTDGVFANAGDQAMMKDRCVHPWGISSCCKRL